MERPVLKIAPQTYLISEYQLVNMYLLLGKEAALLIDTGSGIGPLVQDIAELTSLPLIVVATHGDPDHIGGAGYFPSVYLHPKDFDHAARFPITNEMRRWFIKTRAPLRNAKFADVMPSLVPNTELPAPHYVPVQEGTVFNLGDRSVEVIHTPGHSPGSISLLDAENGLLFTGDMVNVSMALTGHDFTEYQNSLKKLWTRKSQFEAVCIGHELPAVRSKTMIAQYISMTQRLMSGEATATESPDPIRIGKVYREGGLEIWCDCKA